MQTSTSEDYKILFLNWNLKYFHYIEISANLLYLFEIVNNLRWFPIPSMNERRYEASSVVDENDNIWVMGGTHDSKGSGEIISSSKVKNPIF
jgi:hypothetical protein